MNFKYVKTIALLTGILACSTFVSQASGLSSQENLVNESKADEIVLVDYKSILSSKLENLDYFSAKFEQTVVSDSGEIIEKSSGKLAISKPNLANWHTLEPDELEIVSDGTDVWFYNPWIEQVSIYSLTAAIAKTPILLLTSKDKTLWEQYSVDKVNTDFQDLTLKKEDETENFVITSKDANSQIKSLTLIFDSNTENNNLKQFSFLDATGQLSHVKLTDFNKTIMPNLSLFNFIVPEGVQIDDQRAN